MAEEKAVEAQARELVKALELILESLAALKEAAPTCSWAEDVVAAAQARQAEASLRFLLWVAQEVARPSRADAADP